jgi:hypothetical protein
MTSNGVIPRYSMCLSNLKVPSSLALSAVIVFSSLNSDPSLVPLIVLASLLRESKITFPGERLSVAFGIA